MAKRSWVLVVLMVVALGAVGQAGVPATAAAQEKPEKISVIYGGSTWLSHWPVEVGMRKGFFQAEGLGVLWQGFYASSDRMGALASGDLDLAGTGSISAIALMAAGSNAFYVVAAPDSYATVEGIIAQRDIQTIKGLKGKKLAVTFASSAHVLVLDVLEQAGLDSRKDVDLINMKVSDMPAAFRNNEIQAAATWTPTFEKMRAMPGAKELLNDKEFSLFKKYEFGPGPDLLVVRREFADKNPKTTRAFLRGYFKAAEFMRTNPDEAAQILAKFTGLPVEEQKKGITDTTWYAPADQQRLLVSPGGFVQGLKQLGDFLVRHKQISSAPAVDRWVNVNFLPGR